MHETIYAQLDRETIYLSAPGLAMHRVGKKLYLYCEYHDVLDVHERKEMETFLRGLDDVEHMSKILLSHGSSGDSERTLDELIEAGVGSERDTALLALRPHRRWLFPAR